MAVSEQGNQSKRRGGREARKTLRATPIPQLERAVQPGLQGGRYRVLDESQIRQIHEAALEILDDIGLKDAVPNCIDKVTGAGGTLTEDGRLLFPRGLIEDCLAMAGRNFTLCGQDPKHDITPRGTNVYFGTAGAAVHMVDAHTGAYRESTCADLYDIARLVDCLEHIHFFQRPIVLRDLEDPREMDFNTCYAAISGTSKHVGTSFFLPEHVTETIKMLHLVAGGEEKWRARPFVSMSCCFVVPPMKFAQDACLCLEAGVEGGMPILLLAAGQAGATSPAALAGAITQQVAEVLAGLAYVNLLKPGHPAIFGTWPFVSDLRTGAMSGGSGEQALLTAACAQMAQFYDLPGGVPAGMTDSKVPDTQSGYEKGYTVMAAAQAGTNMIYESAGMHASLMGFCLETCAIDNDMLGAIMRTVRGIEVTRETLSVDAIRDVCVGGPGHFLGHEQTLGLMQKEYLYPEIGDRSSPKEWIEAGSLDSVKRAHKFVTEVLARHNPTHISDALHAQIQSHFPARRLRG